MSSKFLILSLPMGVVDGILSMSIEKAPISSVSSHI
jgi:hypothetical protein